MGELIYGAGTSYEMDDRTLAHIKVATGLRLRRQESFYVSWAIPSNQGSGRISIWASPSIPLQFHFSGSRPPELNRQWLQALDASAFSEGGMLVMRESDAASYLQLEAERTAASGDTR
ncbi:DUF7882 family protein [Leifsonia sp. Leaf264]|uniref:DUF7882 family protein n=1 Tax=Leifsonia sp. Leaf264 TaxID=1736314 RepID=UPI0007017054|nr:hypothetical protein [Leifsonia sp. Leaf264]KQO95783.1 hypothetical protein ASF30_19470 [Leifsonia sp. Leaf264]